MSKFRVGDRVRILRTSYEGCGLDLGTTHNISHVDKDGFAHLAGVGPFNIGDDLCFLDYEIESVPPFTIGQTYKTASGRDVTCIALREDGGMFGVFGDGSTSAYGWDKEGNYLCAPAPDCAKYKINLGPVRETVTVEGSFHLCVDGKHKTLHHYIGDNKFTMSIDKVDGKFDWTTAKVTPCT